MTFTCLGADSGGVLTMAAGAALNAVTPEGWASLSSISILASAMSCSRLWGSLRRQRCKSSRILGGVSAGRACQAGSPLRIPARVSVTVSASKGRLGGRAVRGQIGSTPYPDGLHYPGGPTLIEGLDLSDGPYRPSFEIRQLPVVGFIAAGRCGCLPGHLQAILRRGS